jgi:hypothetical protein
MNLKQKQEAAAVWMPIGDLTPWADNPRDNAAAIPEVAKSIKRFGFACSGAGDGLGPHRCEVVGPGG